MYDLAIIGFGATGVSILKNLVDQTIANKLPSPKIIIFSPKDSFAKGLAFGDADYHHKVNTPPHLMGMSDVETLGFENWLLKKGIDSFSFPPRKVYASFISETYLDILNSNILNLHEVKDHVISVSKDINGFRVSAQSLSIISEKIILSLGSLHNSNFPEFFDVPTFINKRSQYNQVSSDKILIAGTGLTAIDVFRTLNKRKNSEVHLFSRNGYAPTCLSASNRYIPTHFSWQEIINNGTPKIQIKHIQQALRKEVNSIKKRSERHESIKILKSSGHAEFFSYLLERADSGDLPYQDTLVSSRSYIHKIWCSLSLKDKKEFQLNHSADWAAWRHPVPREVINGLKEAAQEGRLHIHKALSRPILINSKFTIETSKNINIESNVLIDGTGGGNQIKMTNSPLLQEMRNKNLIEGHPCGGININPLTFECVVKGKIIKGLYNIGPLNKGCLFSTNAFWFNARCAGIWAKQWAVEKSKDKYKDV